MNARGPEITTQGRVEWMDTDAACIHHYPAITRFVESAEAALMRELGVDGYFESAPRVHFEVTYEAPLLFGQVVSTRVHVERLGTTSLTIGFEVWGEPVADEPRYRAAVGRYVTVHLPGGFGASGGGPGADRPRSTPWPQQWATAFGGSFAEPGEIGSVSSLR